MWGQSEVAHLALADPPFPPWMEERVTVCGVGGALHLDAGVSALSRFFTLPGSAFPGFLCPFTNTRVVRRRWYP
jgi:hypothetical protein